MQVPLPQAPIAGPPSRAGVWTRGAPWLSGVLLLVQLLLLLGRFSVVDLHDHPLPWLRLLSRANAAPQVLLSMATAVLLFGRRGTPPREGRERDPRPSAALGWILLAQLASFAALFLASRSLFEQRLEGAAHPELWLALWVVSGCATVGFAALLVLPPRRWLEVLGRHASFVAGAGLLGFAAWAAGAWAEADLSRLLQPPTLWLAARVLGLFLDEVVVDAEHFVLGSPTFLVRVAPECSGFEGIGLIAVFSSAYLGIFRANLRFPHALLLPVLGIGAVWFVNALRLAVFALLGAFGHAELAAGGFHSVAGTLAFCAVALGLVALSQRARFFGRPEVDALEWVHAEDDRTAAHLVPFLLGLAFGMVAQGFEEQAHLLTPLRVVVAAAALLLFRRRYELRERGGLALAVPAGLLGAALWLALAPATGGEGAREVAELHGEEWGALASAMRLLGYVVVFPLAEELAFRGYLMRRLTAADWQRVAPREIRISAWFVSSAVFALLHEHWLGALLAGALYGLLYLRTGSILAAALAHGVTNAALAVHEFLRP